MAKDENGNLLEPGPLLGWPPKRTIWACDSRQGILLVRYFLLRTRHHLVTSDEDRALHDHPWSFVTWLFSGGYWEHTPAGRLWRRRFSILWRPAEFAHRLELERPVWTLVVRFRRRREWGFFAPGGWLDWRSYGKRWCE